MQVAPADFLQESFNPSVGILVFETTETESPVVKLADVSIPQSGFWPLRQGLGLSTRIKWREVSIPQSGFWPLRPRMVHAERKGRDGFNPSVGILAFETKSGVWYSISDGTVSIPQSGFWPLRLPGVLERASYLLLGFQSLSRDSGL